MSDINLKREYDIGFYNNTETIHIPCKQYAVGCQFVFNIIDDDGNPIDISPYNLSFYETKADGNFIEGNTDILSCEDNIVTVITTQQMTAAEGTNVCEIRVCEGVQTLSEDLVGDGSTMEFELSKAPLEIQSLSAVLVTTETFTGNGTQKTFSLTKTPSQIVTVSIDGTETSDYVLNDATLTFTTAPSTDTTILIKYGFDATSDNYSCSKKNITFNYAVIEDGVVSIEYTYDAEIDITTWKFYLEVAKSVYGSGVESSSVISSIDKYVDEAKQYAELSKECAEIAKEHGTVSVVSDVLKASNWVDNTYSLEETYPSTDYNIEITVASTATSAQYYAWGDAQLLGSGTENQIIALGVVPTIDIPILVMRMPTVSLE